MNHGSDHCVSSSYRKILGDAARFSASPPRMSRASSAGYYRRRSGPAASVFSPVPGSESLELTQATTLTNELKVTRTNEKQQLQGLNDRFAVFIEKVRGLEQRNKALEAELATLRRRQREPPRATDLCRREMCELRARLEETRGERSRVLLERERVEKDLRKIREKYEEETRARGEAEKTLRSFKKDVDHATLARLDLERKVESLQNEIAFLRKVHAEEVSELSGVVQRAARASAEVEPAKPDLTSALKDIRGQYESLASTSLQATEEWYKTRFTDLSEQCARSGEAARASRGDIAESRRQLQAKAIEMENIRGTNESLERLIGEMDDAHNFEIAGMQETINQLDSELHNTKSEMAQQLREYQDLLNIKMALDIEIGTYSKLLEVEETHFSTGMPFTASNHGPGHHGHQPHLSGSCRGSREKEAALQKACFDTTAEVEEDEEDEVEDEVEEDEVEEDEVEEEDEDEVDEDEDEADIYSTI